MTKDNKREEDQARRFLTILGQKHQAELCARCQIDLEIYVATQLAGEPYRTRFAATADHLDGCPECAEAYALLYEAAWAEQHGRLPAPTYFPNPDLGFLKADSDKRSWLDQLREAIQLNQEKFRFQLTTSLAAVLQPPPAVAFTRSGSEDARYGRLLLSLTPERFPELDLPVSLLVYEDGQNPANCLLEVTVEPPGQSWPDLGGRTVTVAMWESAQTAVTDDWGTAVFPDIPIATLDSLRLDIDLRD